MRILSVSFTRDLPAGIVKQLQYEHGVSRLFDGEHSWETVLLTCEKSDLHFAVRLPWGFRNLVTRYAYCWYFQIKNAHNFDYIISRHMTFDFFGVFLSWCVKNRITVHHAIEPIELRAVRPGFKGAFASSVESFCGQIVLRNAKAIMAVTDQILNFQLGRVKAKKPNHLYPNGIDINNVKLLDDQRCKDRVEAIFLCQEFSSWHGLERLLDDVEMNSNLISGALRINLVGALSSQQKKRLQNMKNKDIFIIHGVLSSSDYFEIMSKCHVGIASLALDLEGLTHGCTLKVREMLAHGIPVYSNHIDSAISDDFPYYLRVNKVSLLDLYKFGKRMMNVDRATVVEASAALISKESIMRRALMFIDRIH